MRNVVSLLFVGVLCAAPVAAQTPEVMAKLAANPVSQTTRIMLEEHSRNMIAAADLMPADKYSFQPTPAQMTFGQLIAHIVQTNEFLCSAIAGAPKAPPTSPTDQDPKDQLVKALKASFGLCSAVLATVTDAQVADLIAMGPQKAPRVYFMIGIVADWADHYSTEASYLRLNGILPPSAQPPAK
jgi:hypothetical protein